MMAFAERPILGWGQQGYKEFEATMIAEGKVHQSIAGHKSLHSQYVEELAKRGVVGLLVFLCLMLAPLALFLRKFSASDFQVRAFAAAGTLLILCYLSFDLSLVFFYRNNATVAFVFLLAVLWAALRQREKELAVSPVGS
jgi:O-antigen ligase